MKNTFVTKVSYEWIYVIVLYYIEEKSSKAKAEKLKKKIYVSPTIRCTVVVRHC